MMHKTETVQDTSSRTHDGGSAMRPTTAYRIAKRTLDIVVATILLIVLLPFLLIVALLISLDSPGAPIFGQKRMGYNWRTGQCQPFFFLKLRSMYKNTDSSAHERYVKDWINGNGHGKGDNGHDKAADLSHDDRITRVGRFIRRNSIDELPQLWNVIRGEMSLVGPRPVPVYEVEQYSEWHKKRLLATPGITGLWQITSRGWGTVDDMVRLDIGYINNQSFLNDLKILLHTIPSVISKTGAG